MNFIEKQIEELKELKKQIFKIEEVIWEEHKQCKKVSELVENVADEYTPMADVCEILEYFENTFFERQKGIQDMLDKVCEHIYVFEEKLKKENNNSAPAEIAKMNIEQHIARKNKIQESMSTHELDIEKSEGKNEI